MLAKNLSAVAPEPSVTIAVTKTSSSTNLPSHGQKQYQPPPPSGLPPSTSSKVPPELFSTAATSSQSSPSIPRNGASVASKIATPVKKDSQVSNSTKTKTNVAPISTNDDEYITENIKCFGSLLQEGLGFAIASFARSPSVILAALIGPLTLQLAETDSLCQVNPATGYSTGVDGAVCTSSGEFSSVKWNETLWNMVNGTACGTSNALVGDVGGFLVYDIGRATFDPNCAVALNTYRKLTSFTCNCTGDYAFLESGVRPGTVLTFSATVYYLVMVFVAPLVGALSDVTPYRKRMWLLFAVSYITSVLGMSILGQHNLWIGSLFFATCAGPSYDVMCVPIMAYLPEIHHDE
jgi:hypothetical protein